MAERVVVSFRGVISSTSSKDGAHYLERALSVTKLAEAHGGKLCAWSAQTFSFEFSPDDLEEALALIETLFEDTGIPAAERFVVGVAAGELSEVGEATSFASLSWGPPLVAAVALAREAHAGQALVEAGFADARRAEITALGWLFAPPTTVGLFRAATLRLASFDAPPHPEPEPEPEQEPAHEPAPEPEGSAGPDITSDIARALRDGDSIALDRSLAELRERGGSSDLAERIEALAALRRGDTGDALRALRVAADATRAPAAAARAQLAYAVALASAGRVELAALSALGALARAREAGDSNGERACTLFLARLSAATGHDSAAAIWEGA